MITRHEGDLVGALTVLTRERFGYDRAAVPEVKTIQPRDVAGGRYRLYQGITLT